MISGPIELPVEACGLEVSVFEGYVWLHFTVEGNKQRYVLKVNDLKRVVDNPIFLNPTLSKVLKVWLAERVAHAKQWRELSDG